MFVINKQINQYVVCKPGSDEVEFIIHSYYPMDKNDVSITLYQSGIVREKSNIKLVRLTEQNVCEFNISENCKVVSNLND